MTIRLRGFERVMPDARPDLLICVAEAHGVCALLEIHADADEPCHTRRHRLLDHLCGVTQFLEV